MRGFPSMEMLMNNPTGARTRALLPLLAARAFSRCAGLLFLGCVFAEPVAAASREECLQKEKDRAPLIEQLTCYKSLVVPPPAPAVTTVATDAPALDTMQQDLAYDGKAAGRSGSCGSHDKSAHDDSCAASTDAQGNTDAPLTVMLEAHSPNRLGITKDSDDVKFMDFTLSLQHPVLYGVLKDHQIAWLPYIAFTGRFGQYIKTRPSSPVISKRFNPKIFVRKFICEQDEDCTVERKNDRHNDHIDFEYAHLSNGQSVDSIQSFNVHVADLGSAEYAKDYISRGWDYLGIAGVYHPIKDKEFSVSYGLKHYIGGQLQQNIEEYFAWETPRPITKLEQVSGLNFSATYDFRMAGGFLDDIMVGIETGTASPFRYNTAVIELGIAPFRNIFGIPVVLALRSGYNSDLAQYYKKTTSLGLALNFKSFK